MEMNQSRQGVGNPHDKELAAKLESVSRGREEVPLSQCHPVIRCCFNCTGPPPNVNVNGQPFQAPGGISSVSGYGMNPMPAGMPRSLLDKSGLPADFLELYMNPQEYIDEILALVNEGS